MRPSTLLLFASIFIEVNCDCTHSYVTFCDNLEDFGRYNVENWTEVVVRSEDADMPSRTVDYPSLALYKFDKLTSLTILRQIKDVKMFTFARDFSRRDPDQSKLRHLKLYGNEIRRIRFTTFDNMKLQRLILRNNSIENIHKSAFYNCRIAVIDLSDNNLETIEGGTFSEKFLGNDTLELRIRNNRLEAIESDSFPSSLKVLDLAYNKLQILNFTILCKLDNLQELDLSHNRLTSFPSFEQLKNIRAIDGSHNSILTLRVAEFTELSHLEVLDLSHNRISYPLTFNKFNFPERSPPLQISLAFNRLTHLLLQDDSFRHHIVFLFGNPWDCSCWTAMEKFMVDHNVKRNPCDTQFFGKGEVPYCLYYDSNDCSKSQNRHPNFTSPEIEQFLGIIKRRADSVMCSLKPKIW